MSFMVIICRNIKKNVKYYSMSKRNSDSPEINSFSDLYWCMCLHIGSLFSVNQGCEIVHHCWA